MNLGYTLATITIVFVFIVCGILHYIGHQEKKREKLMSKKKLEEKEMKEALEMFEKELSAELDKIALSDNPFEALMNLGKEPELDPVKDFNHPSMMKKPEDEEWQ